MKFRATIFALLAVASQLASGGQATVARQTAPPAQCAGLPLLEIGTPAGFCVGIVAEGFTAPRALQTLPDGSILVADMGGWQADRGSVWLLRPTTAGYEKTRLFDHLDRPNSLALGPDGRVYVGIVHRIAKFSPDDSQPALVDVVGGASAIPPLPGLGRHLLTSLLFDPQGNLFVNVGSATDHCESADGAAPPAGHPCQEADGPLPLAAIRKYSLQWPAGSVRSWETYASGLRNSMAIAIDPRSGALWQGENARDGIAAAMPGLKNDDEFPHDELNRIDRGAHYGWPYCYDDGQASPEFPRADCSRYRPPARLLPAHAAPLGMAFYTAAAFPAQFHHSLIISFHGYRKHGHRLVALLPDPHGAPLGKMVDLVAGSRRNGKHGVGAPVGIKVGTDGDVYFTDDHSGMILRLHYRGKAKEVLAKSGAALL